MFLRFSKLQKKEESHFWKLSYAPGGWMTEELMSILQIPQQWFPDIRLRLLSNPLSYEIWGFISERRQGKSCWGSTSHTVNCVYLAAWALVLLTF